MDSSISSSSSHSKSLTDGSFLWSDGSQTSRYVGFWSYGQPDPANGSCTKVREVRVKLEVYPIRNPASFEIPLYYLLYL